jgi:hypothetical protein
MKETRTKFETTLTFDDFDFIVAALRNASLEITEAGSQEGGGVQLHQGQTSRSAAGTTIQPRSIHYAPNNRNTRNGR